MSDRVRFALKEIEPAPWQTFERLASAFLADEYGELRTLASANGDGGRDALLMQPQPDEQLVCQYSWRPTLR